MGSPSLSPTRVSRIGVKTTKNDEMKQLHPIAGPAVAPSVIMTESLSRVGESSEIEASLVQRDNSAVRSSIYKDVEQLIR
jgi:hypothetical protein